MPDKSIMNRLRGVSAVTDLTDQRIRCGKLVQGDTRPGIVVVLDYGQPVNHAAGTTDTTFSTVLVRCVGVTYGTAKAVADAAEAALNGWSDTGGTPAISMVHVLEKSYDPGPMVAGEDEIRERFTLDCIVQHAT